MTKKKKKKIIISICAIIAVVILLFAGFKVAQQFYQGEKVTTELIREQIEKCAELTTVKDHVTGVVKFKDGDIPIINEKSFKMFYMAEVRMGVDLKDVQSKVWGKKIKVLTPHTGILSVNIDGGKVIYYDKSGSIFNVKDYDDTKIALKEAREKATKKIQKQTVLKMADEQLVRTFKNLLAFAEKEGYKVEVDFIE